MNHIVHHNSRHSECTISENQTGLKPYEVRVVIGKRGANILRVDGEELIVHRENISKKDTTWIIYCKSDDSLAWSNFQGWVDEGYTIFTNDEKESLNLPIDGDWMEFLDYCEE